MNDNFFLTGKLELSESVVEGKESGVPKFKIVAYTGVPLNVRFFECPLVVDVAGMEIAQHIPVRLDHYEEHRIGHTTDIIKGEDGTIVANGIISHDNQFSKTVASSGKLGFPWQASIGAIVTEREHIPEGKSVDVNGKTFTGPLVVARKSELKEISFVDYGADPNTSAIVAKKEFNMNEEGKPIDNKQPVQAAEPKEEGVNKPVVADPVKASVSCDPTPVQASEEGIQKRREVTAAELERQAEIFRVAVPGTEDLQAQAIREGWTPEKFELTMLKSMKPQSAPAAQTHAHEEVNAKTCEIVALRACGRFSTSDEKGYTDQELTAADKYVRCGLRDYIELCCGRQLPNARRDTREWLQAAFSATSLPGILSSNANKVLLQGYDAVDDCWRDVFKVGAVSDFKVHTRYRMNSDFVFKKVPTGGELTHGKISEEAYTQKIDTWGIMFSLTRQMIIDDDLGALFDIPFQIGLGAGQAISDAIWGLVLSNPTLADNKAYFHADHESLLDNNPFSVEGLTAAEVKFRTKTMANGRPLLLRPEILLVPPELLTKAEIMMTSAFLNETTTANKGVPSRNPHEGKYKVYCSPYLSNTGITGYSTTAYYLLANPTRIPTFEVAFLGGVDRPTVEQAEADFNTLGVQFRGYLDFGVKEQDYRGILKVAGTTPASGS